MPASRLEKSSDQVTATPQVFIRPPRRPSPSLGDMPSTLTLRHPPTKHRKLPHLPRKMRRAQAHCHRHGPSGPQPWRGFLSPSTRTLAATSAYVRAWAMELANPIANDLRGGLGAEMMLCQTALDHPQPRSVSEAEVVLVCAFNYSFLAGSCSGHQLKEFERAAAGSRWASVMQPPPRTPADRMRRACAASRLAGW